MTSPAAVPTAGSATVEVPAGVLAALTVAAEGYGARGLADYLEDSIDDDERAEITTQLSAYNTAISYANDLLDTVDRT